MIFDLILRNAKIVTPSEIIEGDLGIIKGKITKIGKILEKAQIERNCMGLHILPGLIDMHVHFRDPGFPNKEDFHSGSMAAAAGGITTVIDMPNTLPPTLTCEALEEKRRIAGQKSLVNYGFYMGFSKDNIDEIKKAKNIAGVKLFMGSTTGNMLVEDLDLIEKLLALKKFVIVHAEDDKIIRENMEKYKDSQDPSVHSTIRSPKAAYEACKTILHLAKKMEARIHITHASTELEVEELQKFKGSLVSADCTTHHLYLSQSAYSDQANFVKMNPPLRTNSDKAALWKALKEGIIQAIATDHAPHDREEKAASYSSAPSGVPGEETLLPLLLNSVNNGEINLSDLCRFVCENPAALLRIPFKGKIQEGYDADLAIVDMEKEMKVGDNGYFTKCGWSPFNGWNLKGWPVMTVVNGAIVYEGGKLNEDSRGSEIHFM